LLRTALETLFQCTEYARFEVVVVDHRSDEPETLAYLQSLPAARPQVKILRADGPFNWSLLNNLGVSKATGELLLFLNNDIEITQKDWLRELASQAWRPDVGAVGAALFYPNGMLQHAGVVLGMFGLAGHIFRERDIMEAEVFGGIRADLVREVTAVTGACLAVRKDLFEAVGGFDAEQLPISYNDVDFCLKLRAMGRRNIYTPFARLIHHESASRHALEQQSARKSQASDEARVVLDRWTREFAQDAFYNPNLGLGFEVPVLAETSLPKPWE
jgi:GT2 family glycosyltransferase